MKVFLIVCITCLSSLVVEAAKKSPAPQKQLQQALRVSVSSIPVDRNNETVHHTGYRSTFPPYRNQSNDTIVSGYISSFQVITSTEHAYTLLYNTSCKSALSLLLLFPNHYFW